MWAAHSIYQRSRCWVPRHDAAAPLTVTVNRSGLDALYFEWCQVTNVFHAKCCPRVVRRQHVGLGGGGDVTRGSPVGGCRCPGLRGLDVTWWRRCLRDLLGVCHCSRHLYADGSVLHNQSTGSGLRTCALSPHLAPSKASRRASFSPAVAHKAVWIKWQRTRRRRCLSSTSRGNSAQERRRRTKGSNHQNSCKKKLQQWLTSQGFYQLELQRPQHGMNFRSKPW